MAGKLSVFLIVAIYFSGFLFELASSRIIKDYQFLINLKEELVPLTQLQAEINMSEKQLVAAVKLVRNMCTGKSKASPEEIDKMHQGNWDVDYNAKIDKDNHFDKKSADAQLSQVPESMLSYVSKCMDMCEHAATNLDDKCIAAWEYSKCMYFCEPEKYFLP